MIEVSGAKKLYSRRGKPPERALDGLDLVVDEGGVHGFLGPNGSGKTSTIRLLLGLIRADAGDLRLFGRPVPEQLPAVIADIGSLVETPAFFPAFSARLNLQLLAAASGVSRTRVEECLELVGLRDRADDRFKGYSLGMKQRLGIAAALLKGPRLLILDEPSNGLDPAGIVEMRELVRRLGSDGRTTVFLSSHLLVEVQHVCDKVSILAHGRCVASGPVAQVLAGRDSGDMRVRLPNTEDARAVLEAAGYSVTELGDGLRVHGVVDPGSLSRLLAEHGHYVLEFAPIVADLETVFLELTGDGI